MGALIVKHVAIKEQQNRRIFKSNDYKFIKWNRTSTIIIDIIKRLFLVLYLIQRTYYDFKL